MTDYSWREGQRRVLGAPKVRDETHWQAQVVRLNTFGASKSHRHPVVIHQHMCWNVSPSLNIVSARVRLMHGCSSVVHVEGHCWLALQRYTHIHQPRCHSHTLAFIFLETWAFGRLVWPLCDAQNVEKLQRRSRVSRATIGLQAKLGSRYTVGTGTCVGPWLAACFYVQNGCWDTIQVACMTLNQMAEPAVCCCSGIYWVHHTQEATINHFCGSRG